MNDWQSYAAKHGIILQESGPCQLCGAPVSGGVAECHRNTNHIAELLDYNDPANYMTRFYAVDSIALQHYEVHGPWNNYIHFARLVLLFEKNVKWDYTLTPLLSKVVNDYKRDRDQFDTPPGIGQRGELTSLHILAAKTPGECKIVVKDWAHSVYKAFYIYRDEVEVIVSQFLSKR